MSSYLPYLVEIASWLGMSPDILAGWILDGAKTITALAYGRWGMRPTLSLARWSAWQTWRGTTWPVRRLFRLTAPGELAQMILTALDSPEVIRDEIVLNSGVEATAGVPALKAITRPGLLVPGVLVWLDGEKLYVEADGGTHIADALTEREQDLVRRKILNIFARLDAQEAAVRRQEEESRRAEKKAMALLAMRTRRTPNVLGSRVAEKEAT